MISFKQISNDLGPYEVFIFYGYLLLGKKCSYLKVFTEKQLKAVFVKEYRKLKVSHSHLEKKLFKKSFLYDLATSYFYIKKTYFNNKLEVK